MDLEPHAFNEPTEDPLDGLLRHASPPEPDAATVARLERHWNRVRPRSRVRPLWIASGLAAASLAAVLFVWSFRPSRVAPRNDVAERESEEIVDPGPGSHPARLPEEREPQPRDPEPVDPYQGRAPTIYEQAVFRSLEQRQQRLHRGVDEALLQRTIEQLAANPNADAAVVAEPLRAEAAAYAEKLARQAHYGRGPRRAAAVRLLGELGNERSVAVLMRLCRRRGTREAALRSLVQVASPETLARAAAAEPSPELRQALAGALLDRRDDRAIAAYLTLVGSPVAAGEALRALGQTENPPVDQFFAYLGSEEASIRRAAAIALGQVNGPATSDRLIRMVLDDKNTDAAMLALLLCRSLNAERFLDHAARDRSLIAAVNLARCQVQLLFN